ncbi:MAG: hypothetical protein JRM82_04725 [Nitrososphaerota archaeon]|nr:hypothetical protein [Nitrososphaerota archaeon]
MQPRAAEDDVLVVEEDEDDALLVDDEDEVDEALLVDVDAVVVFAWAAGTKTSWFQASPLP